MRLSAAVEDYCACGRFDPEVGHAHTTFQGYRNRLEQFQRWCRGQELGDPLMGDITYDLLRKYYFSIVAGGVRPRTQRQHIHALRFIFRYFIKQGVLSVDPTEKLKLPKLDAAERKLVSDEDLEKLWEASLRQADDFKAIRDRAVLSVLIFTALRRQELLDLQVTDVDLDQNLLLVRSGKGSKSRTVPLCQEAHDDLEMWLNLRRRLPAKHDKLFCVDQCRPLGENGLSALVRDVAAIAGLKQTDAVRPHTLRHAAATRFLNNGASLKDCQVLLGHSDLKTTAMYLHANEQSIRPMASLLGFRNTQPSESNQEPSPIHTQGERGRERSSFIQQRRRAVTR